MLKRLWIISECYQPNENTTSYIMTKIAEGLSDEFEVNVITSSSPSKDKKIIDDLGSVNVYRVKDSRLNKNNFFKRTIKLIVLGLRLIVKTAKLVDKGDKVLVVTNPATIIFLMRILRSFKSFEFNILVHDIFPENLVVAEVLNPHNVIYRITLRLFNWAYSKADRLIVIGRDMESFMRIKLGAGCPPMVYIPNFADVNIIEPQKRNQNKLILECGLIDKFIVLYTGNIGRAQDIDNILKTMELLREKEEIQLLVIGDGAKVHSVKQYIIEKQLNNITLLPSMKREFSNDFLNAGDIGLVSLQKGRRGIGIPSKTYPLLAAGKPILAVVDEGSEIYSMVHESRCGWWTAPGNSLELSELIYSISRSQNEIKSRSSIARKLACEKYSVEEIITLFKTNLLQ